MSVAEQIKAAVAFSGYPCYQNEYTGKKPVYFVFNINTIPANFADDRPRHERHLVQLHLFAPPTLDTEQLQGQIKAALESAGFVYPSKEDASGESGQHVVFETEIAEAAYGVV